MSWRIKQNSGSRKVAIKVHCKYCTGVLCVDNCAKGTVVCSLHCARKGWPFGWAMPSIKWFHWPAFTMPGRSTVCCLLCKGHCVSLHCAHERHCVIMTVVMPSIRLWCRLVQPIETQVLRILRSFWRQKALNFFLSGGKFQKQHTQPHTVRTV